MEIIESCSTLLSNREVLDLLSNSVCKKQTNLATILYETTTYLNSGPAAIYSTPDLANFLAIINEKQYNLSKIEKIQIANLRPQNETELHLIIDNIEDRFTEEQRSDIVNLIEKYLQNQEQTIIKKIKQEQ